MLKVLPLLLVCAAGAVWGQSPAPAPLAFEVASVKSTAGLDPAAIMSGKMRIGMRIDAARVEINMLALADLIRIAYKVKSYQVQGPEWIRSERYNIAAKLPEGAKEEQVPEMLQALLAERFKLTIHRESKEQNVYALVQAKGGHKLKPAEPVTDAPAAEPGATGIRMSGDIQGKGMVVAGGGNGNQTKMTMKDGLMHMENSKLPISGFVDMLARFVDKPVVDQTGLQGDYQIALDLSMEDMKNIARASGMGAMMAGAGVGGAAEGASDPQSSVFTSVQQLGLKLEGRKLPIDLIVIDHAEKVPTEN